MTDPRREAGDRNPSNAVNDIIGREDELNQLFALVDALPAQGGPWLLRGGPGMGKTTLLDAVASRCAHDGVPVVSVRAVPTEQHLPLVALYTLLRPVLAHRHQLTEGHRDAIEVAFGLRPGGGPPAPFLLALAVLELVIEAAIGQSLVLIVDDAHWLDDVSAEVLAFLGRRLGGEPVVLLIATRDAAPPGALAGIPALDVAPLRPFDAHALLTLVAPQLDAQTAALVLSQAAGNPLALLELPAAAHLDGAGSGGRADGAISMTGRLESVFASAFRVLPEATRAVLLAMAVQDRGRSVDAEVVAGHFLAARVHADDRTPAVRAGLLHADGTQFRHPLVRSAILSLADPESVRRVHRAWADVLAHEPELRTWHRALGSSGPDESTARELDTVAGAARRRGAFASALRCAELASHLSVESRGKRDRLIQAGYDAYELGRPREVKRLIEATRESHPDPDQVDRIGLLEGLFDDGVPGDLDGVRSMIGAASAAQQAGNVELAVLLLMGAGRRCWWADLATVGDDVVAVLDRLQLDPVDPRRLHILAHAAPLTRGRDVLDGVAYWSTRSPTDATAAAELASAAFNLADFDRALLFANQALDSVPGARSVVDAGSTPGHPRCWAALFVGQWDVAFTAGDEAHRLALETGQPVWAAHARLGQADLAGRRGDSDTALALLADAERLAVQADRASVLGGVEFTRGIIELGRGRPEVALDHLRHLSEPADRAYHSVERLWLLDYLAEAAAYAGQSPQYRPVISAARATFANVASPGYTQAGLLAGLLLGGADEFDRLIAAADQPPGRSSIWYRARVDLARGMALRRGRQVAASRRPLLSALATFEAIGARAWALRAQTETGRHRSRTTVEPRAGVGPAVGPGTADRPNSPPRACPIARSARVCTCRIERSGPICTGCFPSSA